MIFEFKMIDLNNKSVLFIYLRIKFWFIYYINRNNYNLLKISLFNKNLINFIIGLK